MTSNRAIGAAVPPIEMQQAPRWLLWSAEVRTKPDGTHITAKVPRYIDGDRRRGDLDNDAGRLVDYAQASAALQLLRCDGLGFALGDGWQGIDFDKIDERPALASEVQTLPGYVETSPSGRGVHAIGYGAPFDALGPNGSGIEAYSRGRFFTFTGRALRAGPIVDLAPFVASTLAPRHAEHRRAISSEPRPPAPPTGDRVLDELADALRYVDADDRDAWIGVGQALCALGDAGFALWAAWSSTDKYPGGDDLERWHTFKGDHTGYASIFNRAASAGWKNPRKLDVAAVGFGAAQLPPGASLVPVPPAPPTPPARFPRISIADVHTRPETPQRYVIDKILPVGVLTLLGAHGGAGKSMASLQAAVCVAAGLAFMGLTVERCRVLFFSGEDSAKVIRRRLRRICEHHGVDPATIADALVVLDATASPVLYAEGGPTSEFFRLQTDVAEFGPGLIVVDNASDAFAANENERHAVREFVRLLASLAEPIDAALLLLAHVDKATVKAGGSEGYSGSTAWHNSARSRLFLTVEGAVLTLTHQKSNAGLLADPLYLMRGADGVLSAGQAPGGADDRATVLRLISDHCTRGVTISPHQSARNNAFSTLSTDPEFPASLKKQEFARLLSALFSSGEIFIDAYRTADRKDKTRIAVRPVPASAP